jgi:hypothetical protein
MRKQDEVAEQLEQVAAEVEHFIERSPESAWHRVSAHDGRTVGALAYHCALGNDLALGWVCQMLVSRPVYETADTHDALNVIEAKRGSELTKSEVAEELRRTTERTARFLRSLTDEELERSAMHGVAGRELSVGQFMGNFSRHMRDHLETLKESEHSP